MASDVGQLPAMPADGCDVEQINDEEVLRRMVSTAPPSPFFPLACLRAMLRLDVFVWLSVAGGRGLRTQEGDPRAHVQAA